MPSKYKSRCADGPLSSLLWIALSYALASESSKVFELLLDVQ